MKTKLNNMISELKSKEKKDSRVHMVIKENKLIFFLI